MPNCLLLEQLTEDQKDLYCAICPKGGFNYEEMDSHYDRYHNAYLNIGRRQKNDMQTDADQYFLFLKELKITQSTQEAAVMFQMKKFLQNPFHGHQITPQTVQSQEPLQVR